MDSRNTDICEDAPSFLYTTVSSAQQYASQCLYCIHVMCRRECREHQGIRERPVRMENQARRVHRVYQGQREEGVRGGSQEKGDQSDPLGGPDHAERSDLKDLTDCR